MPCRTGFTSSGACASSTSLRCPGSCLTASCPGSALPQLAADLLSQPFRSLVSLAGLGLLPELSEGRGSALGHCGCICSR